MGDELTLADLLAGESGIIIKCESKPPRKRQGVVIRLLHLGFIKGTEVYVEQVLNDTYKVKLRGSTYALSRDVADKVYVKKVIESE